MTEPVDKFDLSLGSSESSPVPSSLQEERDEHTRKIFRVIGHHHSLPLYMPPNKLPSATGVECRFERTPWVEED